jgi:peptidoglycan hydrolase-like protein with peptidoglycan-binding domain
MGVIAARLVFLAFLGLSGAIIYNALYLQDLHGTAARSAGARPHAAKQAGKAPVEMVKLPPASTDLPPPADPATDGKQLLIRAIQRELAARGFDTGPEDGRLNAKTKAAITAYQKSRGLPATGEATDALLRNILLGESVQSTAATGSVEGKPAAATGRDNVKAVQQVLADLGYNPGPIDGALGEATTKAIVAFQRDRKIAQSGRITPELLAEIKRVTGQDLTKMAAGR